VFSGKLGLLAEAGSNGLRGEDDVSFLTDGVQNVAAHLGMIERPFEPVASPHRRVIKEFLDVRSPTDGLFEPTVPVDAEVTAGQLVGRILDFDGKALADIVSPENGVVLGIVTAYGVGEGATVIGIGKQ
jgi:predicted deacylase